MDKNRDSLGRRMKEFYENVPKTKLMRRVPVAMRFDGRAFHTFTKGFKKPFDHILMKAMQLTMLYLCENIQGAVFGYTQSDEITIILQDYEKLNTAAWFDYEVQKMCSVGASMATLTFYKELSDQFHKYMQDEKKDEYADTLLRATESGATWDCRVFNIPKEEVTNLIYWRQLDASRNSVQMLGRAYFTHKELDHKNCSDIQDMLHEKYGINWNNCTIPEKRGTACRKNENGWYIDEEMPILKGENRKYVEDLVFMGD